MRITTKGQVTIPAQVREQLGFLPHTEVDFVVEGEVVKIVKAKKVRKETRGQELVRRLSGAATSNSLSTDEIMALMRDS